MLTRPPHSGAVRAPRPNHQNGFALMDVLVSILLFSVGVLALVGLQAGMTRNQTESKIRADASYLANELIGLMWAQHSELNKFTEAECDTVALCQEWQTKVASTLPNGSGKVEANNTDVTVTITWRSPSGDTHKFVTLTTIATN